MAAAATGHANGHAAVPAAAPLTPAGVPATPNGAAVAAEVGQPKKPFKPQYPLTSWADTKQNLVCISFLLGCTFTLGVIQAPKLFSHLVESVPDAHKERFWNALTGPRLGIYVALLVVFHMLEFLTTATYNPVKANVRSFLLDDRNHNAAHVFAFAEMLLEEAFLPERYLEYKHSWQLVVAGLATVAAAQYLRSLAMITAAANFSHLIALNKAPEHSLVRTGIYGWSRHPSYVAFFYWALGTQVFVGNPVSFVVFSGILYRFFSHRIKVEEWYLKRFFQNDYVKYQQEVPTRLPFIP